MFANGTNKPKARLEGTVLKLGKSLSIRGDIFGEEDLVIDGKVEGNVCIEDHHLTIAGLVEGDVSARHVTVLGQVRGNVIAAELVELRETAFVEGDVCARRFSIEENASLNGRIETQREDRKLELVQGAKPSEDSKPGEAPKQSAPAPRSAKVVHVKV
jgi:cytoskeletal protein CcmA (bactofilin family)